MYVWVRATVDWDDEEAFAAAVPDGFRPTVELWDATFTMPFRRFRARLREIAASNWLDAGLEVCMDWEDVPDRALVLPSDDDDWFAPDIATVLERRWAGSSFGCSWTSSFVEVPLHWRHRASLKARRALPLVPPKHWCTTNNYALIKDQRAFGPATSHLVASRELRHEPRYDVRLSCMNRTLASQTSLRGATTQRLLERWGQYRRLYGDDRRAPPWCAPYIGAMRALMEEIEPS